MYKRIEPQDLVVGKTYYIVPTARLITHNMKDRKFIREHLKTRFLFPEGKLETMRDVPEGSSYGEIYAKEKGSELYPISSYWSWFPACSFTGLKSHGKPLIKSVKNFVYGPTKVSGYTFFSTELTPDPVVPAPEPAPEPVQVVVSETPAPALATAITISLKMPCPNCGKCLEVENGILKMKISE
jgi:hypothetical protein